MSRPKFRSVHDPSFRRMVGTIQAIKLALAELRHEAIGTTLVESDAEAHALSLALLAHTRDPQDGLETFRVRESGYWRLVTLVLDRALAGEQGG